MAPPPAFEVSPEFIVHTGRIDLAEPYPDTVRVLDLDLGQAAGGVRNLYYTWHGMRPLCFVIIPSGKHLRKVVFISLGCRIRITEGSRMRMCVSSVLLVVVAAACGGDSSGPTTVTLPLTSVDARALPTTVPAGSGTVQVVSGRLVGDSDGPACSWYIAFNPGGESFGSIGDCTVDAGDVITLTFDAGPPNGSHAYRFGQ